MGNKNWSANVSMVYWISAAMGQSKPSHALACKIADRFTFCQLDRIYRHVKRVQLGSARLVFDAGAALLNRIRVDDTTTLIMRKAV